MHVRRAEVHQRDVDREPILLAEKARRIGEQDRGEVAAPVVDGCPHIVPDEHHVDAQMAGQVRRDVVDIADRQQMHQLDVREVGGIVYQRRQ